MAIAILPMAYSSNRSQPIIHAINSPNEAVRVGVRAPRNGNHRGEFRVAESRKAARERDENKQQRDCGPSGVRGLSNRSENSRSDNRGESERRQIDRAERPLKRAAVLALHSPLLGFRENAFDRFSAEQFLQHAGASTRQILQGLRVETENYNGDWRAAIKIKIEEEKNGPPESGGPNSTRTTPTSNQSAGSGQNFRAMLK